MTNNELTVKNQGFMILADFNISEGFSEELAGLDSGFDRIKIPAGGGLMFEMPSDELNEANAVREFSAVILHHHPMYMFYKSRYNGSNNPPDYLSVDGITGTGTPGGPALTALITNLEVARMALRLAKISIRCIYCVKMRYFR